MNIASVAKRVVAGVILAGAVYHGTSLGYDTLSNPVVLQVGADAIRAREYADAVANMVKMMDNSFGMEMDWTNAETVQMAQLFMGGDPMSLGKQMVTETHVIAQKAAELGVPTAEEIDRQYAESRAQTVEGLGGEEQFQQALRDNGLTESLYEGSVRAQMQLDALSEYYFGENGEEPIDEQQIEKYFNDNYLAAKHILILTYDPQTGEEKRTLEQALGEAQVIHARLERGEDFDTLMNELSEDSGLAAYPDGYVFTEGDMVSEFYEGTKALEVGKYSAPIQSSYGYHIIRRQSLDPATQLADYRETIIEKLGYNIVQKLNGWVEEAKVTETDALSLITYANLYDYTTFKPAPKEQTEQQETEQPVAQEPVVEEPVAEQAPVETQAVEEQTVEVQAADEPVEPAPTQAVDTTTQAPTEPADVTAPAEPVDTTTQTQAKQPATAPAQQPVDNTPAEQPTAEAEQAPPAPAADNPPAEQPAPEVVETPPASPAQGGGVDGTAGATIVP